MRKMTIEVHAVSGFQHNLAVRKRRFDLTSQDVDELLAGMFVEGLIMLARRVHDEWRHGFLLPLRRYGDDVQARPAISSGRPMSLDADVVLFNRLPEKVSNFDAESARKLHDRGDRGHAEAALDLRQIAFCQSGTFGERVKTEFTLPAYEPDAPGDAAHVTDHASLIQFPGASALPDTCNATSPREAGTFCSIPSCFM